MLLLFIWKVNFGTFHREISVYKLSTNAIMLQHLIILFPLYYLSSDRLRKVKNRGKFWTFTSKSDCGKPTRGGGLQEIPNIVIWLGNFWYFGKLVAEERWPQLEVPLYSFLQIIWILYTTQEWPTPITISDKNHSISFLYKRTWHSFR